MVSRLLPTFWNKPSEIIMQIDRKKHMSTNITKKLEGKVALVTGGHHDEARRRQQFSANAFLSKGP